MIQLQLRLCKDCVLAVQAEGHALSLSKGAESASCMTVSLILRSFAEIVMQKNMVVAGTAEQSGEFSLRLRLPTDTEWLVGASQLLLQSLRIIEAYYPDDVKIMIEEESNGS